MCCRRRQKENQEDLLKKVNDETLRQLTKQKEDGGPSSGGGRKVSEVVAYRSLQELPATREMAIQVRTFCLLPFELSLIWSAGLQFGRSHLWLHRSHGSI